MAFNLLRWDRLIKYSKQQNSNKMHNFSHWICVITLQPNLKHSNFQHPHLQDKNNTQFHSHKLVLMKSFNRKSTILFINTFGMEFNVSFLLMSFSSFCNNSDSRTFFTANKSVFIFKNCGNILEAIFMVELSKKICVSSLTLYFKMITILTVK